MKPLLADFQQYLEGVLMRQTSTVSRYVAVVEEFLGYVGSRDPLSIDRATIEAFVATGTATGTKPRFNNRLAAVRAFYAFAVEQDLMVANPAARVRRQKVAPKEPLPLSLDEYLSVVEAAERFSSGAARARNVAVVEVLFHVGLRVAELVSLDVEQVDLQTASLHRVVVKGGKTATKALNDVALVALERYLRAREYLAAEGETALLVSNRGTRLSVRAVQEIVTSLAARAGIERRVTCHMLRHSNASELAALGAPLSAIQTILGHERSSTTERYIHLRGELIRRALADLAAAARARQQTARNPEAQEGK